jgi:hypothetical protein
VSDSGDFCKRYWLAPCQLSDAVCLGSLQQQRAMLTRSLSDIRADKTDGQSGTHLAVA